MSLVLAVVLVLAPTVTPEEEWAVACERVRAELAVEMTPDRLDEVVDLVHQYRVCAGTLKVESHEDARHEPEPEARSTPSGDTEMGGNVEQWRGLVTAYFGADKADTALCLMGYESGGNPNAKNPSSSASGLFQLMGQWHSYFGIDPFDPEQNVAAAAQLQAMYGWSQWSPWNRGACH